MAPVDDGGPLHPVFVAEAVLRLLVEIGGDTGTLLLVDDLHWADDETLAVVEYLADHAGIARLLLVLTARREEGRRARELLHALSARGAATVIDLAPAYRLLNSKERRRRGYGGRFIGEPARHYGRPMLRPKVAE